MAKSKYVKITLMINGHRQGSYVETIIGTSVFVDGLIDCDMGDVYLLEVIEMDDEEFESLPEFYGF